MAVSNSSAELCSSTGAEGLKTWEEMLKEEFSHVRNTSVARLNNGSFGSCPSFVLKAQAAWQKQWLQQPDEFYYGPLQRGLQASRAAVASVIHACNVEEVVLVDNVTTAAAIVVQDFAWGFAEGRYQRGDAVLMLSCAYGAVKKCIQAYAVRAGASVIEVDIGLPLSGNEQIVDSFRKSLESSNRKIRLAIIDHIVSMPSVVMPVKQLVQLCREAGVEQVFVDGAHSIGNVSFNVEEIDADFYSSNLHKWFFTPHAVAFLHCKPEHMQRLHHPVVSHNYNVGLFDECAWVGTRDYSPQLSITSAVEFVSSTLGGLDAVTKLNHETVVEMGQLLARAWGTSCGTPPELASAMIMVELPSQLKVRSHEDGLKLRTRLRSEFAVEVPLYYQDEQQGQGRAYARISHQVYNTLDEYLKLRDAVDSLVAAA